MDKITPQEFLIRQPNFPQPEESDIYYHDLSNRLMEETTGFAYCATMPDAIAKRIALTLVGYLQDIASDAGLWRSFVDANRELYNWSVPFHNIPEEYVDYELNQEDVRFLVWYVSAMLWREKRLVYPHDKALLEFADKCFDILSEVYEECPIPKEYNISRGLDLKDPDDREKVYHLGNWLFLHSYLLTPAFAETLSEIISQLDSKDPDFESKLNKRLEEAMMEDTTGPLALFIPEWVYLVVNGKLPVKENETGEKPMHPYFEAFTKATNGERIAFFDSYEKMNRFFIDALGWEEGQEHLAQAKGAYDYVLMVDPHKGMLMARDIARCIAAPGNDLYNKNYASRHAMELLTERGCCPGDLLQMIFENNWLPDAHFPESDDYEIVKQNRDFIARCYLQLYYRGD